MKKTTILLLFISLFKNTKAQITFPAAGADWHYMIKNGCVGEPCYYTNKEVKYIKDTLIMEKNAAVINTANIRMGGGNGNTYIYTSNDTVYFYNALTLNKWQVLYNFNCTAGQGWQICFKDSFSTSNNYIDTVNILVDSVKYNTINGMSLKTLYVEDKSHLTYPYYYFYKSVIYDRIGDTTFLFDFVSRAIELCDGCGEITGLLCYQDSTFALYQPDTAKACDYHTSGIEQLIGSNLQLSVYPNPATNKINVEAKDMLEIKLLDIVGRQILNTTQNQIDISNLPNGIYFVQVKTTSGISTQKIIVQH